MTESIGVYVARGHVEMAQDDRVVMADTITYNERAGRSAPRGNVDPADAERRHHLRATTSI